MVMPHGQKLSTCSVVLASVIGVYGHTNYVGEFAMRCGAMGIDWMNNTELSQAIPPAYSEFLCRQALRSCKTRVRHNSD
jgi:hypothetical protein